MPPCLENKWGCSERRQLRYSVAPSQMCSPVRAVSVRPTQSTVKYFPTKSDVARLAIGERLLQHAAGVPVRHLTISPHIAVADSPQHHMEDQG